MNLYNYNKMLELLNITDEQFRLMTHEQRALLLNNLDFKLHGQSNELRQPHYSASLTVCFTGFEDSKKSQLKSKAIEVGMMFKDTVV